MSEKRKIKPVCLCEQCGAEIRPSVSEAGKYIVQFRKTPYNKEQLRKNGAKGGRPKKVS